MAWQIEIRENEAGKFNFLVMASNGEVIAASVKRDLTPQDYHDQDFCEEMAGELVCAGKEGVNVTIVRYEGRSSSFPGNPIRTRVSETYSLKLVTDTKITDRMRH